LDPYGKVVFFKAYDLRHARETESPEARAALAANSWVGRVEASSAPSSGILLLPAGPALIAACPILTSERKGPERGVLVMTRILDAALVARLKAQTHSSIAIEPATDPALPADFQTARTSLLANRNPIAIQAQSQAVTAGYKLLEEVNGQPALLLRVDMSRAVFQQGQASLRFLLGALCLASLTFGSVTMLLLRRVVLARLIHLNAEVRRIGEKRDLSERVGVTGQDELSKLGGAINNMLEALQNGDTQFREISENIQQVFWVKDESSRQVAYVSPPWETSSGLTRESLYSASEAWLDSIHPEDRGIVDGMLKKQQRGEKGEAEFRMVRPDGTVGWNWCRYFPVFNAAGDLVQTVGLAEEITEWKNKERSLQRSREELWNVMTAASDSAT
jgi:PAS domain S-box-containing protein